MLPIVQDVPYTPPPGHGYVALPAPKSQLAAILLALFLGTIGIHRFYLGHNGLGITMLLITVLTCCFGLAITGIWAIIDIVLIATGSTKDKFGRPLV